MLQHGQIARFSTRFSSRNLNMVGILKKIIFWIIVILCFSLNACASLERDQLGFYQKELKQQPTISSFLTNAHRM